MTVIRVSIGDLARIDFSPPESKEKDSEQGGGEDQPQSNEPVEQEDTWPPKMQSSSSDEPSDGDSSDDQQQPGDDSDEGDKDKETDQTDGKGGEGDEEDDFDEEDSIAQDIEDRLARRREYDPEAPAEPAQSTAKGTDGTQKGGGSYKDVDKVKPPAFSWQTLLRQFVSTSSRAEPTYAKINRRAATAASGVAVMGRGAIKPGERVETLGFKMFAAFDTSGSMASVVPSTMALIQKFIQEKEGDIQGIFGVGILGFTKPELYAANLKAKKAWAISTFSDIEAKQPQHTFPIEGLFTKASWGGDELPDAALAALDAALGSGYNVLLMTDSHIVEKPGNLENLRKLLTAHKRGLFIILDGQRSYQAVVKAVGQHNFITHL